MTRHRSVIKPHLSTLEQLPPEIMQLIFSFIPTHNLPLVSPRIASKLSTERMFLLCGLESLLKRSPAKLPEGSEEPPEPDTDDLSIPSNLVEEINSLLRLRWVTWTRFQALMRKTRDAFIDLHEESQSGMMAALVFDTPSESPNPTFTTLGPDISIPEKLLHGPWSTDKTRFLYYLTWLGMGIDWENSTSGEVACSGLGDAIREKNRIAVASLLAEQIKVQPTQDNLRSAIMQHGCDQTIVFHILSASVRARARNRRANNSSQAVNPLDASIWSWIKRLDDAGDKRSKWLKGALRAASDLMTQSISNARRLHEDLIDVCGRSSDGVEQIPLRWD